MIYVNPHVQSAPSDSHLDMAVMDWQEPNKHAQQHQADQGVLGSKIYDLLKLTTPRSTDPACLTTRGC
jgi:hypothetical protein